MTDIIVFLGEYLSHILIAGILVFWWENKKRYPKFLWESFLAALLSRGIITELIRFFWERPRPFVEQNITPLIEHAASASFPSGHATFFFALGTILFFYNKTAGALFLLGAAVLTSARVFAFLHWPSDIIGGAVIGIASAFLVVQLSRRFFK
ncbi:phosphatase PAP2 family protein [Patescibacteria group bacterium]|nr:phosphatase PAP2 family protein [Patescibacteria group bacterium]